VYHVFVPELPEVQTIINGLSPALRGATIEAALIHRPDIIRYGSKALPDGLIGRRIKEIDRDGKRIVFRLAPAAALVVHLGMTGRLTLQSPAAALNGHTHLRLRFRGRPEELRFQDARRFGGVWFMDGSEWEVASSPSGTLGRLGPDALTIRVPVLRALAWRRRQIKSLLMDQRAISGLGNIYCDEALFAARIHPLTRACDLTEKQVRNLACSIRKTLRAAVAKGGSTLLDYRQADGSEGLFQMHHRVYGRKGRPCVRCGRKILRIQAAGRSTHMCPKCQPR
jgi:formamidopyrimidine-DNA glycosylase